MTENWDINIIKEIERREGIRVSFSFFYAQNIVCPSYLLKFIISFSFVQL